MPTIPSIFKLINRFKKPLSFELGVLLLSLFTNEELKNTEKMHYANSKLAIFSITNDFLR